MKSPRDVEIARMNLEINNAVRENERRMEAEELKYKVRNYVNEPDVWTEYVKNPKIWRPVRLKYVALLDDRRPKSARFRMDNRFTEVSIPKGSMRVNKHHRIIEMSYNFARKMDLLKYRVYTNGGMSVQKNREIDDDIAQQVKDQGGIRDM